MKSACVILLTLKNKKIKDMQEKGMDYLAFVYILILATIISKLKVTLSLKLTLKIYLGLPRL